MTSERSEILLVDCPDQPGLVHDITGVLGRRGANILTNHEFVDLEAKRFFMRTEFVGTAALEEIVGELRAALPSPSSVRVGRRGTRRIVVLATREPHCLGEILLRNAHNELGAGVQAVVSNHDSLKTLTDRFGIPFNYVPHGQLTREAHEAALLEVLEAYQADYLVLAKYMRILSPGFIAKFRDRIINIHHSFLPAFVGPNPYRQAFERGVKIIGATAHFVTEALDEGPIIAQAVTAVDHSDRPSDMAQAGRDIEKIVLAKALKLVFDERIFLDGHRTIVFE